MEMMDYVHKCLVCDGISYEVDEGDFDTGPRYTLYKCGECLFEWEVVEYGRKESL